VAIFVYEKITGLAIMLCQYFVPLTETPLTHNSIDYEWITFDEFLCCLPACENTHSAFRWICERTRHKEHASRVELVKSSPMSFVMNSGFGQAILGDFIEHDNFHKFSSSVGKCLYVTGCFVDVLTANVKA
jgi:hypothetical protein